MIKWLLIIAIGVIILQHYHVDVSAVWDYAVNLFHFLWLKIAALAPNLTPKT